MSNKHLLVAIMQGAALAALLALTACSSLRKAAPGARSAPPRQAATAVTTYLLPATLKAIDTFNHEITLLGASGSSLVLWSAPSVTNFNQLRIGEGLLVTVAEELVTSMRAPDTHENPQDAASVLLAPAAGGANVVSANTVEIPCQLTAIDPAAGRATVLLPINRRRTLAVHPRVTLHKFKPNQPIVIRTTKEWAVRIEKR